MGLNVSGRKSPGRKARGAGRGALGGGQGRESGSLPQVSVPRSTGPPFRARAAPPPLRAGPGAESPFFLAKRRQGAPPSKKNENVYRGTDRPLCLKGARADPLPTKSLAVSLPLL